MTLASRCREAISHVAMLKKELAMHQRRAAEAVHPQKRWAVRAIQVPVARIPIGNTLLHTEVVAGDRHAFVIRRRVRVVAEVGVHIIKRQDAIGEYRRCTESETAKCSQDMDLLHGVFPFQPLRMKRSVARIASRF